MDKNWEILIKKAGKFNINLTDKQIEQFRKYWEFLYEYNKHTNLVSSAELGTVVLKHFADSLSIGLLKNELNLNDKKTILDIGIGGGFPGIPIIIAFPSLKLCAVDSVGKKTKFISELSEILGMSSSLPDPAFHACPSSDPSLPLRIELTDRIEVVNSRAEELIKETGRRSGFDIAVSRAVSRLNVLLEYTLPFIKTGGYFIAYKAKTFQEEIEESKQALFILGGEVIDVVNYTLSDSCGEDLSGETRNLILVKKIKATPEKYPRKTGIPLKKPL